MSSRRAFASKGSIRVVSHVAGVLVWTVPFTAQAASLHDATSPVGALRGVSWSRLSEQNFRIDKWSLCRG